MARAVSLGTKIEQINGLSGTSDVNDWESGFIVNIYTVSARGTKTAALSEKQIEIIDRIWERHFA